MNNHYYRIAKHTIVLSDPEDLGVKAFLPSLEPFSITEKEADHILFSLTFTREMPVAQKIEELASFEWEDAECTINIIEEGYEVLITPAGLTIPQRMHINKEFTRATAQLNSHTSMDSFIANNFLMMLYAFATAPHATLMFHASVIRNNNKGYLFLGKSGTGKSTHTRLWLEHIPGSELLNDDNPIVRLHEDGRVIVYGSPWSGKTPCYRNEEVEVGAFVRLKQAPANLITQDKPAKAFASLLPSCSCLKQNTAQYDAICHTIAKIASHTPVWKLECLPDANAAKVCYEAITHKE